MPNVLVADANEDKSARTLRVDIACTVEEPVDVRLCDPADGRSTLRGPINVDPSRIAIETVSVATAGVVAVIMTCDVVAAELPDKSVAVHVTVVVPKGNDVGEYSIDGCGSTVSTAVAMTRFGYAGNVDVANVWSTGGVMMGGFVSTTPTLNDAVVLLAALIALVAVHETVDVPRANRLPDTGAQAGTSELPSVSDAVTANDTYAPAELVASAVTSTAP